MKTGNIGTWNRYLNVSSKTGGSTENTREDPQIERNKWTKN